MRKYLSIVFGVLLILGLAVTASAMDADVTLGGDIMVRGWYVDNVNNGIPSSTASQTFYTTDANITVDAKVSDNVRACMQLETTSELNNYSGEYIWAETGGEDYKPNADLKFRQLWIQYTGSGLLGVPAGIKVGHMPLSLGEKVFVNNERFGNDAIVVWVDPTKELHLSAVTTKLNEGAYDNHTDDIDAYVAIVTYQIDKDILIGAHYTFIHTDGYCPSLGTPSPNVDEVNFHNVGIHSNGNIAGLTYAAEVDFQFGTVEDMYLSPGADQDVSGYAIYAKAGYDIDPVTIRASFGYGSGDSDANDNDCEEFQALQGPDEIDPISRLVHYTQIYERWIDTAASSALLTTSASPNTRNTGLANTTLFNLGLDVYPTDDITLSVDGFYLQASEEGAWEDIVGHSVSDELGWELDCKGTYKIAKNLEYFVEAAGFWPGDFYQDVHGVDETVTQVVHGLLLTF